MSELAKALRRLERAIEAQPMETEKIEKAEAPAERHVTRRIIRGADGRISEIIETSDDGTTTKTVTRDEDHRIASIAEVHAPAPPR